MSVGSPLSALLKSNFRAWISAKGFWLVAAAALLPLVLTGAWVGAHQADVKVTDLTLERDSYAQDDAARFTATVKNVGRESVGPFNFTLAVGPVQIGRLLPENDTTVLIDTLAPGEERVVELTWTARPGVVYALATADPEDVLGERDEFNNQIAEPLAIRYKIPDASESPSAPLGLSGDDNATTEVDLEVLSVTRSPAEAKPGDNVTFTLEVRNNGADVQDAQVALRVLRSGVRPIAVTEEKENMSFAAGETKSVSLEWTVQQGVFWQEGYVLPPSGTKDAAAENNRRIEPFAADPVVTPDMKPPEPDERLTIKEFYIQVLSLLHLRVLLPLIALFYAAGVIADERERGSLPYVLTRPIPRWLIPITKFAASFLVAAVAIVVGVALTYLFLFGTSTQSDIGYLTTPLLASLLTLFAYGALFILLGTIVERPYLWGLGIVLGWENAAPLLVPWVSQLTLSHHIGTVLAGDVDAPLDGWRLDAGLQWLPEGEVAIRALIVLLAIGVGALVLASAQMRRREFEVG